MSTKATKFQFKVVVQLVKAKKPYYLVRAYETGKLIYQGKKLVNPDYALKWLLYNQSLVEYGHVRVKKKEKTGTITIGFTDFASRHFKLFLFHVVSVLNIKSARKADCLARCWSRIDATSPIIDSLWELSRMIEPKRFTSLLRGYCLCK